VILSLLLSLLICVNCWAGIDFDTTDDIIEISDNADFDGAITVTVWMRVDTNNINQCFVGRFGSTSGADRHFKLLVRNSNKFRLAVSEGVSGSTMDSTNNVGNGDWYHIAATIEDHDQEIFRNGVSENTSTYGVTTDCARKIDLGQDDEEGSVNQPFSGEIKDFALWSTILTSDEINLIATSGVKGIERQIQPSNLVVYLPLDDVAEGGSGDGVTFVDRSGNGNDGTGEDNNGSGLTSYAESENSYP
jgi:hypothetical protein